MRRPRGGGALAALLAGGAWRWDTTLGFAPAECGVWARSDMNGPQIVAPRRDRNAACWVGARSDTLGRYTVQLPFSESGANAEHWPLGGFAQHFEVAAHLLGRSFAVAVRHGLDHGTVLVVALGNVDVRVHEQR